MQAAGVELRERTAFTGLIVRAPASGGAAVVGVETSAGPDRHGAGAAHRRPDPPRGRAARRTPDPGRARPATRSASSSRTRPSMSSGCRWSSTSARGSTGGSRRAGSLFGWSDPDEAPGEAREIDWPIYDGCARGSTALVPVTRELGLRKIWAATIDFTPDHLPILGPAITPDGSQIDGVTIASAGGHGMMWGPGVARVAADLAIRGSTDLIDVTDLGLDRFDARRPESARDRPDRAAVPGQRRRGRGSRFDRLIRLPGGATAPGGRRPPREAGRTATGVTGATGAAAGARSRRHAASRRRGTGSRLRPGSYRASPSAI